MRAIAVLEAAKGMLVLAANLGVVAYMAYALRHQAEKER